MNSDTIFFVKKDTHINSNINEWILSKGIIHKSTLTISKNESSTLFVSLFKQLIQNQEIKVSEDDEEYSDLKKLVQLGFLGIRNKNKKVALIVEESAKNFFENYLKDENICVSSLDEFITQDTLNILIEEKNNTKYAWC